MDPAPPTATPVALVTGASGNLGSAVARALRGAGWNTVLADRSAERLRLAVGATGPGAEPLLIDGVDLTDPDDARRMVERATARFGALDAVINTVGAHRAGHAVHEDELETWDLLLRANLRTALVTCRAALPGMLARGRGRIVNVASRDALAGAAGAAAYGASKAALLRFTESLAAETLDRGITANCVLPGAMDTPQNRAALPPSEHPRLLAPAAIADVIVFLASDAARSITGAAIPLTAAG